MTNPQQPREPARNHALECLRTHLTEAGVLRRDNAGMERQEPCCFHASMMERRHAILALAELDGLREPLLGSERADGVG